MPIQNQCGSSMAIRQICITKIVNFYIFTQSVLIILYYQLKSYLLIQESCALRIVFFQPLDELQDFEIILYKSSMVWHAVAQSFKASNNKVVISLFLCLCVSKLPPCHQKKSDACGSLALCADEVVCYGVAGMEIY